MTAPAAYLKTDTLGAVEALRDLLTFLTTGPMPDQITVERGISIRLAYLRGADHPSGSTYPVRQKAVARIAEIIGAKAEPQERDGVAKYEATGEYRGFSVQVWTNIQVGRS